VDSYPWGEDAFTKALKLRINPSFCQVSSSYLREVEIAIPRDKRGQHSKSKKECATKDHTHGLCKLKFWLTVFLFAVCTTGWNVFDFQVTGYSTYHSSTSAEILHFYKQIWFPWIHSSLRNWVPFILLSNGNSSVIPNGGAVGFYQRVEILFRD
jgi:hypothetical protein